MIMRKIRLDDSCLNHLTNIPVGFTRKSSYIHSTNFDNFLIAINSLIAECDGQTDGRICRSIYSACKAMLCGAL